MVIAAGRCERARAQPDDEGSAGGSTLCAHSTTYIYILYLRSGAEKCAESALARLQKKTTNISCTILPINI